MTVTEEAGYTWTLPVLSEILDSGSDLDLNNVAIREQVEIIEHTLESFGAPATVVEITTDVDEGNAVTVSGAGTAADPIFIRGIPDGDGVPPRWSRPRPSPTPPRRACCP